MSETGDAFIEVVEDDAQAIAAPARTSKVAVVDDDEAVHEGTRFALHGYALDGRRLEILSAFSAAQARSLIAREPDLAVILLDVVMETDRAGLDLIQYIRKDLGNDTVRIILRTGQPGQAPEREVVVNYDINDYKAKTELTADKLFTTITSALRSYEQLRRMKRNREVLHDLLGFTKILWEQRSLHQLAQFVLDWANAFARGSGGVVLMEREGGERPGQGHVLAAAGGWDRQTGERTEAVWRDWEEARGARILTNQDRLLLPIVTGSGRRVAILVDAPRRMEVDAVLVDVFKERVAAAFDNVMLQEGLRAANETLEQRVAQRTVELTAANRRLEAQWSLARRTAAFQREVLGIVAHDLKNPLAVVLGRAEMLRDALLAGATAAAQQAQPALAQVEKIRESARRLTAMVDRLISSAMADAHEIPVHLAAIDARLPLREAVEANRGLAERKQQRLTLALAGPLPVMADHERLRDALDNLVSNAVKYTPEGGAITVSGVAGDADVVLTVTDTGAGLAPEDFPRLFSRFGRLSAQPTAGESSTGLGLSIAKRIVDLHEGEIRATSPGPGQGSSFSVVLRRAASSADIAA